MRDARRSDPSVTRLVQRARRNCDPRELLQERVRRGAHHRATDRAYSLGVASESCRQLFEHRRERVPVGLARRLVSTGCVETCRLQELLTTNADGLRRLEEVRRHLSADAHRPNQGTANSTPSTRGCRWSRAVAKSLRGTPVTLAEDAAMRKRVLACAVQRPRAEVSLMIAADVMTENPRTICRPTPSVRARCAAVDSDLPLTFRWCRPGRPCRRPTQRRSSAR